MNYVTNHILPFSALTMMLAAIAAFAAGRAIAMAWRAWWLSIIAAVPLGISARLLDYMLVGQTTNAYLVLLSIAMTSLSAYSGYVWHRKRQMAWQYPCVVTRERATDPP